MIDDKEESLEKLNSLGFHSIRLLLVHHDCPHRDFAPFGVYYTFPPKEDALDIEIDNPDVFFTEIMSSIRKWGHLFPESDDCPQCNDLKILTPEQRKSMPSVDRVVKSLLSNNFPSLEEYLQLINSPLGLYHQETSASVIDWEEVKSITDELEPKEE